MNDKDIIKALGSLRQIKPSKDWQEESRAFLLSKVEKTYIPKKDETVFDKLFFVPRFILKQTTEQAWAVALIIIILAGGGVSASQAAKKYVKPGDSLYLARVISEKAQVAVTFNKEKKAKLGARLASNRARQATEILADLNIAENEAKAEKLSSIFSSEIKNVRASLAEIKNLEKENKPEDTDTDEDQASQTGETGSWGIGNGQATDANKVFAVDSEKINQGLKIHNPDQPDTKALEAEISADIDLDTVTEDIEDTNSSTVVELLKASAGEGSEVDGVDEIMEDAMEYFDAKDFDSAREAWQEVDNIINEIIIKEDAGAVKGTSTVEISADEASVEDPAIE